MELPPKFRHPASLTKVDGILVTHTHFDHFEGFDAFPDLRTVPVFGPGRLKSKVMNQGFRTFVPLETPGCLGDIEIAVTGGRHGKGLIGLMMGTVNGFLLRHPQEPSLFITGDTVLTKGVVKTLANHSPDVVVPNLGRACLPFGEPITMGAKDLHHLLEVTPHSLICPVHLDSVNHGTESREFYRAAFSREIGQGRVVLLNDGESLEKAPLHWQLSQG